MAHPHLAFIGDIFKNVVLVFKQQFGKSVFPFEGALDFASQRVDHVLHAVTDAQNRYAQFQNTTVDARTMLFVDAARATGQDNALQIHFLNALNGNGGGFDNAVYTAFTNAPGNELIELRTEIDDQYHEGPFTIICNEQK